MAAHVALKSPAIITLGHSKSLTVWLKTPSLERNSSSFSIQRKGIYTQTMIIEKESATIDHNRPIYTESDFSHILPKFTSIKYRHPAIWSPHTNSFIGITSRFPNPKKIIMTCIYIRQVLPVTPGFLYE